jgi:glycosyltransferase involved in cell wall biosynthesis
MLAAKISRIKTRIHTVAGLPLEEETGIKYALLKRIEKITYSAANHVWPNSNSLYNFIKNNKLVNEKKLKVLGRGSSNGVSSKRFNRDALDKKLIEVVKKKISYNDSNTYLLYIGRLVKDKGIIELVAAFSALQKTKSHLKLILVGVYEASLDPLPDTTVKEIFNNPFIINVGWSDEAEYYMALAHYFVFPSYREGFPNVLLEAGAIQLPIVCSRIGGNIDIVTDNKTGILFKKKDINDLYLKLEYALNNPGQMISMAKQLQGDIKAYYEREAFWNILLAEYRKLI